MFEFFYSAWSTQLNATVIGTLDKYTAY